MPTLKMAKGVPFDYQLFTWFTVKLFALYDIDNRGHCRNKVLL